MVLYTEFVNCFRDSRSVENQKKFKFLCENVISLTNVDYFKMVLTAKKINFSKCSVRLRQLRRLEKNGNMTNAVSSMRLINEQKRTVSEIIDFNLGQKKWDNPTSGWTNEKNEWKNVVVCRNITVLLYSK